MVFDEQGNGSLMLIIDSIEDEKSVKIYALIAVLRINAAQI